MARPAKSWLVVGWPINWHTAFNYGFIWGMKASQRSLWEEIHSDSDLVFFYVTAPVSGVVGAGLVRTKLQQLSPLWPEERERNEVIWPLRFEFDVLTLLPPKTWPQGRYSSEELKARAGRGFQSIEPALAEEILRALPGGVKAVDQIRLAMVLPSTTLQGVPAEAAPPEPRERAKSLLVEIGRLQKFVADAEYPLDTRRLDVVWRRVQRSVPSFVFEIQVGGNLTEALAKLKQARDIWNSNIYLVGKEGHRGPVGQLLGGSFHEIQDRLRFIEIGQVEQLYERKRSYRELENQLGILL